MGHRVKYRKAYFHISTLCALPFAFCLSQLLLGIAENSAQRQKGPFKTNLSACRGFFA
jgi:hypothetical protein